MDGKLDQWKELANSEVKRMGKTVDDLVSKTLEGMISRRFILLKILKI